MNLSRNFTLAEFTRSDAADTIGDTNQPTPEHLINLRRSAEGMEDVRRLLGTSIVITSGYRNPRVNASVGGVPTSAHALGFAVDFRAPGVPPLLAGRKISLSNIGFDQLIHEVSRNILHISFAPRLRRQVLTQCGGPGTPFEQGLTA